MQARISGNYWQTLVVLFLLSFRTGAQAADPPTVMTRDGHIQLQLPDGYGEKTPSRPEISLQLVNEAEGTTILLVSESQRQFDSLQDYAERVRTAMTGRLKDPQADPGEKLEVSGNPAIRYEITGIIDNLRMAFQVTIIQTETRFTQVVCSCLRPQFADHKEGFAKVGRTLKEIPSKPEEKAADQKK